MHVNGKGEKREGEEQIEGPGNKMNAFSVRHAPRMATGMEPSSAGIHFFAQPYTRAYG